MENRETKLNKAGDIVLSEAIKSQLKKDREADPPFVDFQIHSENIDIYVWKARVKIEGKLFKCVEFTDYKVDEDHFIVTPYLFGPRMNKEILVYEGIYDNLCKKCNEVIIAKAKLTRKFNFIKKELIECTDWPDFREKLFPHILYYTEYVYERLYKILLTYNNVYKERKKVYLKKYEEAIKKYKISDEEYKKCFHIKVRKMIINFREKKVDMTKDSIERAIELFKREEMKELETSHLYEGGYKEKLKIEGEKENGKQ